MRRRKYPKVTGVLYTKNLREGSGRSSWSMLEAEDGNHYKCADCNIAIIKSNPNVKGILKILDGKLYFILDK